MCGQGQEFGGLVGADEGGEQVDRGVAIRDVGHCLDFLGEQAREQGFAEGLSGQIVLE